MTPQDSSGPARRAMRLSLGVGILMLAGKTGAYLYTGSAAILSDAAESVIHVVAVGFAAISMWLTYRPPDSRFRYGYERISFFSAGFEGAMIMLAAVFIIVSAVRKWMSGLELENLGAGTLLIALASIVNAALGWYLLRAGRRAQSLILEANGRHVLTDSWTSFGVVGGLCLVLATGWKPFDPLFAIAVALNILWSGSRLVRRSIEGLMDYADPATAGTLQAELDRLSDELGMANHGLRFRNSGGHLRVEVHLLFPFQMPVGEAHRRATELERRLCAALDVPADVTTHLEAIEDHAAIHGEPAEPARARRP